MFLVSVWGQHLIVVLQPGPIGFCGLERFIHVISLV